MPTAKNVSSAATRSVPGVGCLGDEGEAARREARHELDRDERDGGGDRRQGGAAERRHERGTLLGAGVAVARLRRRATRIPAAISAPPASSSASSVSDEQHDGDRGSEERLEVGGERRAGRPDAVERAEPELVRQDERARASRRASSAQTSQPRSQSWSESCGSAGERDRDPRAAEDDGADPRRRVAAHERGDEDRVARPRRGGEDAEEDAAEVAREAPPEPSATSATPREGEQRAGPEARRERLGAEREPGERGEDRRRAEDQPEHRGGRRRRARRRSRSG